MRQKKKKRSCVASLLTTYALAQPSAFLSLISAFFPSKNKPRSRVRSVLARASTRRLTLTEPPRRADRVVHYRRGEEAIAHVVDDVDGRVVVGGHPPVQRGGGRRRPPPVTRCPRSRRDDADDAPPRSRPAGYSQR